MGGTLDAPQADPGKIEATQPYSQAHQVPVGGNLLNVSRTPGWAREGLCARVHIRQFRKPRTKSDLRAFLGTVGYYRRFIRDYSTHAFPLTEATKNASPNVVAWNIPMYDAFQYMCNVLCDVSVLFLPTLSDVFVLQTDASGRGVGAVLSVCRDGDELPVGYFSRKLKPAERKLECLAVVQAIDYFAAHLIGRPFMVETDHKALQYLQSSRYLNGRLP